MAKNLFRFYAEFIRLFKNRFSSSRNASTSILTIKRWPFVIVWPLEDEVVLIVVEFRVNVVDGESDEDDDDDDEDEDER